MSAPSDEEQISAMLGGIVGLKELADRYFGGEYARTVQGLCVSRAKVVEHVLRDGVPSPLLRTSPATFDGLYLATGAGWLLYRQERGERYGETEFSSYLEVVEHLVDYFIVPPELLEKWRE